MQIVTPSFSHLYVLSLIPMEEMLIQIFISSSFSHLFGLKDIFLGETLIQIFISTNFSHLCEFTHVTVKKISYAKINTIIYQNSNIKSLKNIPQEFKKSSLI